MAIAGPFYCRGHVEHMLIPGPSRITFHSTLLRLPVALPLLPPQLAHPDFSPTQCGTNLSFPAGLLVTYHSRYEGYYRIYIGGAKRLDYFQTRMEDILNAVCN